MRTATVVLVLALAGCGGTSTDAAEVACESVPAPLVEGIATGAKDEGLSLDNAWAYKSPDFESVYFIAADMQSGGEDVGTGVWSSNSLTAGEGMILAVDAFAKEYTDWGAADETAANISAGDPAVATVKECAA